MAVSVFLSIIIPVFNAEKYLSTCIDSLLTAATEDMEIILVDDGSTDKSVAVIESYCCKWPNIQLVRQTNSGPSAARNKGLNHAKGKYIAFVDADDYVNPQALALLIAWLRRS